jgi:hypothetical protein
MKLLNKRDRHTGHRQSDSQHSRDTRHAARGTRHRTHATHHTSLAITDNAWLLYAKSILPCSCRNVSTVQHAPRYDAAPVDALHWRSVPRGQVDQGVYESGAQRLSEHSAAAHAGGKSALVSSCSANESELLAIDRDKRKKSDISARHDNSCIKVSRRGGTGDEVSGEGMAHRW